jgi:hypothetical protein
MLDAPAGAFVESVAHDPAMPGNPFGRMDRPVQLRQPRFFGASGLGKSAKAATAALTVCLAIFLFAGLLSENRGTLFRNLL